VSDIAVANALEKSDFLILALTLILYILRNNFVPLQKAYVPVNGCECLGVKKSHFPENDLDSRLLGKGAGWRKDSLVGRQREAKVPGGDTRK